jgi:hypothetical protein
MAMVERQGANGAVGRHADPSGAVVEPGGSMEKIPDGDGVDGGRPRLDRAPSTDRQTIWKRRLGRRLQSLAGMSLTPRKPGPAAQGPDIGCIGKHGVP